MSRHVHIAYDRFKDSPIHSPISAAAWVAAVGRCPALARPPGRGRDASGPEVVALAANPRERLRLDVYGLGTVQNPSRAMVEAMFEVATTLGAGVYSERCKRYASPDDWERRTRKYREAEAARKARLRRGGRRRLAWILGAPVLGMLLAFFWY
jgi:hypothetical protein